MELTSKTCTPCRGGIDPMDRHTAETMLDQIPGWELTNEGRRLERSFRFGNFVEANRFADRVGELAESEGHHPEITFGYGYAKVAVWTHKIGGLHENDFIFAAKTNEIAA